MSGLVGGEIGQVEIVVPVDEEIGGADVAVVDIEDVMAGEDGEDDLVDDPDYQ